MRAPIDPSAKRIDIRFPVLTVSAVMFSKHL